MNNKRKNKSKSLGIIALMLILCLIAGLYIVKTAESRAEEKAAQAELEAQQEAAEAAAEAERQADEQAAAEVATAPERVYSYRGSSDDPLFSMAAYDNAVNAGTGFISMPFVVSKDGTLFIADDDESQNLTGYSGYFSGMTDAQIEELDTKDGGKLVKFSNLTDKYGNNIFYIIELKYTSERNFQALEDAIKKYELQDNCAVSCMYFSGLRTLENSLPDIPKIFLCSDEGEFNEALGLPQVDVICVTKEMMTDEYCSSAHAAGKKFCIRTLNGEEDIRAAIAMGADSYFTDETALAVSIERGN